MSAGIQNLRVIIGGVVVVAAGASGYFVQYGAANDAPLVATVSSQPQSQLVEAVITTQNIASITDNAPIVHAAPFAPTPPAVELVTRAATPSVLAFPTTAPSFLSEPSPETITLASTEAEVVTPSTLTAEEPVLIAECEAGFTAMAAPGAMVDLTLEAPCYADQMVDIFHAGMRFTEYLDENGLLQISVPVMEEDAFFNALFTDGNTESADILMLTLSDYHRVALFWKGEAGFGLYALENDALYGEIGHVSVETPYDANRGVTGEGGYIAELGQSISGYHTVIYSYPAMLTDTGPLPEISIEVDVSDRNCESEVSATLMQFSSAGVLESSPVIMAVPECAAIGEYLVLKDLPQDLRIAGN